MEARLIYNKFKYIQYTKDGEAQFSSLKHFCHDLVKISYETCEVGDFWLVQLYDGFINKFVCLSYGDYIVKIEDEKFIKISSSDFDTYFIREEADC